MITNIRYRITQDMPMIKVNKETLPYNKFLALNKKMDITFTLHKKPFTIKKGNIISESYYNDLMTGNVDKNYKNNLENYNKIIIYCDDDDYKDSRLSFNTFLNQRENDKIFTYNTNMYEWNWLNADTYKKQFKDFKKHIVNKKLVCDVENIGDVNVRGIKWYYLNISNDEMPLCIGCIEIFSIFLTGFTYYFKSKTDRDAMLIYLNKI